MKIDEITIKKIAALAAIEMGPEELEAQRRDLERISTFAETLAGLDTEGVPEQTHPFGVSGRDFGGAGMPAAENRLREDAVTNEDRAEEWVKAAPDSKGLYFRVPRTVEE